MIISAIFYLYFMRKLEQHLQEEGFNTINETQNGY